MTFSSVASEVRVPAKGTLKKGALPKKLLTGFLASVMLATAAMPAQAATPPTFPNNIVIFPERDFLTLEGYQDKVGQEAMITVLRRGEVSGKASGTIAAGDPALEVNHPGGVCWNEEVAPGIKVTPDIKAGDLVRVRFADGTTDSARTLNARITDRASVPGDGFEKVGDNKLVVRGKIADTMNQNFFEQRIINPDLDDTDVGRRDVRSPARPGPYTSTLNFTDVTGPTKNFVSTYTFQDNASTALNEATQMRDIAAQGQMRVLAWMAETADGDRQGITIYEFGEVGGPGMGGCPSGPSSVAPQAPANVAASAGNASITAKWAAAKTIPDGSPITGYQVTAINEANGQRASVRVAETATTGTVQGLANGQSYLVEVTALSAAGSGQVGNAGPLTPQGVSAPTIGNASSGSTTDTAINARARWSATEQPAGITVDGYRVTAYDASNNTLIKSKLVNEPASPTSSARSTLVPFASAGDVYFKVQAVDAEGRSPQSAQSNTVTAQ